MQITIFEHRGIAGSTFFGENNIFSLMGQDAREFRIDALGSIRAMLMRRAAKEAIVRNELERCAEFYEDGADSVEGIYAEFGMLNTALESGIVLQVTETYISVFLPVHDDFEDQETHWVAAVPVMRELMMA